MSQKSFSVSIIILLIIQLSVVLFAIPPHTANAYGNGFTYSRSITIDHTKVPNTDQSNFPVLVSGTYSYLATVANSGKVQNASGYDVGFYTNSDCSTGKMNWETEIYTAASGLVNYWVKVPTLTTASDYVFYMCYGNSSITTDQSSATSVWDSNYKGVWHLPNGTTLTALDSTSNANNSTAITTPIATTGQVDGGASFGGSDYISVADSNSLDITTAFTISLWFKPANLTQTNKYLLSKLNDAGVDNRYSIIWEYTNNTVRFYGSEMTSGTFTHPQTGSDLVLSDTNWHYITYTWNGAEGFACLDGSCGTAKTGTNITASRGNLFFGSFSASANRVIGSEDEIRISASARSTDWITTEYNNQNSPSTFYTIGSESSDTTAPVFSSVTPASSSSIKNVTSSSAIAFTTDEALASGSITITRTSGTADATVHTCTLKGTALNVGAHTINLSDTTNGCTSDVSNLVSGTVYTFVLAGSDTYSNAATPITSTSVTFDNTSPTISEVTPVTTPTNDNTPNYTFTTNEAGTISYGGDCSSVTTSASSGSNTITFSTLSDGAHSNCTVVVTEAAGNASNSLSVTAFTVDTIADAAPGTPNMTAGTDSGTSSTDDITSDTTPDFTISCVSGSTVTLYDNVTSVGTGTCSSSTVTITSSALSEATHATMNAKQTDAAGNVSAASSNLSIVIDATAPSAPGTPDMTVGTDSGTSSTDNITSDTTPDFTMSCETGATVTLKEGGTSLGTGTCSSSSVTITSSVLSEAAHTIKALQTDAAGNVSADSSTLSGTVDATAPTITNVSSDKADGSYTTGEVIDIDVTFSETVISTGNVTVTLETGTTDRICTFSVSSATTGTCDYTVQAGDTSADLTANGIAGTIADVAGNAMSNFTPATNLAANKAIVIYVIVIPTVTTSAASSVSDTAATLNGSIDTLGGENATARGFEWGTSISYGATTTETGSHSTGAFTASLSSLTCATEYHFRGYAVNSAGTGYGSDQTFTTSACPVVTPPSSGGGGGGGFSPPYPRTPEGGYVFFITPNPTTNGFVTLHFVGGQDITRIQIADNPNFSPATYIDYVTSLNWTLQGGIGEKTLYAKFCNQYARCGETVIAKVMYTQPVPPPENTKTGFIENLIPDFIKKISPPEPKPQMEQPIVTQKVPTVLEGDWKLLSNSLTYNFVLAPLPSDIAQLTAKFPELEKVFARLGIAKISDLEKLKNTSINLPVIADKKNVPSEILVAEGGQGLITLGSSLALTSGGEVQQKIETIAGKSIVLSVKPESPAESIKGYLLFKRKPEKTAMEIPANSLVASALLARAPVAQISSETPTIEQELLVHSFEYTDPDHDGIFTAEISTPEVEGEYEVLTIINYKDKEKGSKELRMITVVDPEGYVYKTNNGEETRISNVKVSIFSISNDTPSLWDASKYNQDNPQITDNTGKYSFLVPPGKYYITAEAKGYKSYKGDEFEVKEGAGVHFNIEMTENGPWFKALVDWKMLIIIIFGIALLINFINDRRLRKQLSIK